MRHFGKVAGLITAALLLTACATTDRAAPPAPTQPSGTATDTDAAAPRLETPDSPPAARPRARPAFDARRFVGLAPTAIAESLGAPTLKQQETFAEVWQYVSGPCVLHLYFYRPKGGAADAPLKVEHALIETRPGPWGDNLKPEGVCALEFSGRRPTVAPAKAPGTKPRNR